MSRGVEKTFIERRVFCGAEVKRGYRVVGIECVQCKPGEKPSELTKVQNIAEYSAGCGLHRGGCFGHMCETPTGSMLPPHSLSFRSGDIRTQYYIASISAFERDIPKYVEELKRTNYGKEGHLRSIMSTPVSGSARLVAVPHNSPNPRELYISSALASKIVFCLPERDSNGSEGSRYVERSLEEGDFVMLERAPSLTKFNNQPFRMRFWPLECLGIHPAVFDSFHGDYDGDEAHIYVLGTEASLREAKAWVHPINSKFLLASTYMTENFPDEYTGTGECGDLEFLKHTTVSFQQIQAGDTDVPLGNLTRNKLEHLRMFGDRLRTPHGTETFLADARKGVEDIMRQQLSQGVIGDMSRVARISASCFVRGVGGGTYVVTRLSKVLLNGGTSPSTGSPAVRCIMLLCQVAQQAALDAHRVGSSASPAMDLVADLLKGRLDGGKDKPCRTIYVLSGMSAEAAKSEFRATWAYSAEGSVVATAMDDATTSQNVCCVKGAYSPVVLSSLPDGRRREACSVALSLVFNYYGLTPEEDDMDDLVEAMCYRVQASVLPITTREGMLSRRLGWMETLMACDYTKMSHVRGSSSRALTATSATMCANFAELP